MKGYLSPQPRRVIDPWYSVLCEKCGWEGSSEQCSDGGAPDYDDVICPHCHQSICGNASPNWDEDRKRWKLK